MNLLFICDANLNRSPTFEKWFNRHTKLKAKSAGIFYGYPNQLTQELLDWADKVFVMELAELKWMKEHNLYHPDITIVGIGDYYVPDEKELIELIEYFWKNFNFTDAAKSSKNKIFIHNKLTGEVHEGNLGELFEPKIPYCLSKCCRIPIEKANNHCRQKNGKNNPCCSFQFLSRKECEVMM